MTHENMPVQPAPMDLAKLFARMDDETIEATMRGVWNSLNDEQKIALKDALAKFPPPREEQ